jgi:hypothetical protein
MALLRWRRAMSDPNIVHKTRLSKELDSGRTTSTRTIKTVMLVTVSTVIWGIAAFLLIKDTGTAVIATMLIGLAALTTRIFDND